MRTVLTIAGSDSGGGAGIQADLKTFAVHGVFGTSAVTALTAQNTRGVTRVMPIPVEMVVAQVEAVLSDLGADAIKIGMLANAEIARAVARLLSDRRRSRVVLDPVMVAKGGSRLLDDDAVDVMRSELVRLASVVTANVPEAEVLTGLSLRTVTDLERAAAALLALGAKTALVKGGHLAGPAVDVFFDGHTVTHLEHPRIATAHTHGTGCTLAAALASRLALGDDERAAAEHAKRYVTWAIQHAPGLGHGHGPLGWGVGGLAASPSASQGDTLK